MIVSNEHRVPAVFPGSFNPLHEGHRRMRKIAEQLLGVPVCYELSITNADKPKLDYAELERRLSQFRGVPCWVTQAPMFAEKARLFPGATFVVGADTIYRIVSAEYYLSSMAMQQSIDQIKQHACRFLVFGRLMGSEFLSIPEPSQVSDLCSFVSESEFRMDVSSEEMRRT